MSSIFQKIYLLVVVLIFALLVSTTLLNIKMSKAALFDALEKRALILSRVLQDNCKYAITVINKESGNFFIDRQSLHSFIDDIRNHEKDVERALILDLKGTILSSLDHTEIEQILPQYALGGKKSTSEQELQWLFSEKQLIITSAILIDGTRVGTAVVHFSLTDIEQQSRRITQRALITGVLFLLLGAIISRPIVSTIVRPIHQLNQIARQIGSGNLDVDHDIRSRDEVGQLATAFSQMADTLKLTLDDLNHRVVELKESERSARDSEKKYRQIFANAVEGIFQIDLDGRIITANPALFKMFGLDPDHGHQVSTELENHKAFRQILAVFKANEKLENIEIDLGKLANQPFTALVSARYTNAPQGNEQIIAGTVQNITANKERELAIKERQVAESANKAKSVFLSNMSHELRTPLNAILGYSQIFSSDVNLTAKQQDGIRVIHQSGEHLLLLITDILDLAKIEAGKMELVPSLFRLPEFMQGITDIIKVKTIAKDIEFRYEADDSLPAVIFTDELRLRQVILNLLANAVKFTDHGHCRLQVSAQSQVAEQTLLTITVEDSGVGVPPEMHREIFQPFQQTGDRLKHAEGTGLGLDISSKFVNLMGSKLELTSPINEHPLAGDGPGSSFSFTIAVANKSAEELPASHVQQQITGYAIIGQDSSPKRILIVDDQDSNRKVMRDTLEHFNFVSAEQKDVNEIMITCADFKPDLILMDLQMPDKDGFTCTAELQNNPDFCHIPVVAVTAAASNDDRLRKHCFKNGFSGYVSKPVVIPALLECLAQLLPIELEYSDKVAPLEIVAGEIIAPPQELLLQFADLTLAGDISAISRLSEEVGQLEKGKYQLFSQHLNQMADRFQIIEIEEFIAALNKGEAYD